MKCNAGCCKTVAVEWDRPNSRADWEQIRWLVAHKNICVYLDHDGDWLIEFETDCEQLDKNNRCKIYETRMPICREHPADECEMASGGDYHREMYRTVEDVDKLIAKKYGNKK
ncbi:MAG: YkgJ family cysteine cluster protein [Fibrobacteres bacterium]|nr:YkgJ family cysteine cluster protein [Fibrobacterota bacterium]